MSRFPHSPTWGVTGGPTLSGDSRARNPTVKVEMSEFLSSTREQFAEELERLLRKADERRPVALIVSGEPGLGKSTTLETVRQRWERGEGTSVPVLDPEDIGTLSTVLDPGGGTPTLLVVDDIDQ